jgi:TolB-like protein/Tfp pilus assembly protein PilF
VKVGGLTRELHADKIRVIAACGNYTTVSLTAGNEVLVRRTMKEWSRILPAGQFLRLHRGLLVNLDYVTHLKPTNSNSANLHFAFGERPLAVKRRHWRALRTQLDSRRAVAQGLQSTPTVAHSIVVLPFVNLSDNPANEIFCDGITEELLNVLAKFPCLRVVARTSAFYFKGRNVPVPEIARQLGVEFVVEGSVRQVGRRFRVTAQIIDAANGFHAWSDNFEHELTPTFAVHDKIAGVVAKALQPRLEYAARSAPTRHNESHRHVLEGRHFWNLRTSDGLTRAEAAYVRALALDPALAQAHAGLAEVYVVRAMYRLADGVPNVADDLEQARAAAARALQLDSTLVEPRAALAFALFHEGLLAEAAREFSQVFTHPSNYATGYQFQAWTLCAQGRLEQAIAVYEKAILLDPLSFINLDRYAAMQFLAGNFSLAFAANERAAALRPDVVVGNLAQRATILFALGRRDDAIAAARTVRTIAREMPFRRNSDADAVFVLRQAGLLSEASNYAGEVLELLPTDNYRRGFVLAACRRFTDALPSLEFTPNIMMPQLYWSVVWDEVRDTRPFRRLIARLGRTEEYELARAAL